MKKKIKIGVISLLGLFAGTAFASGQNENMINNQKEQLKSPVQFQQVIEDYKDYASKISPEIREEVIEYRKSVAKLNKEKKLLYRRLSQEAQQYLKKEQEYKKKLPLRRKGLIDPKSLKQDLKKQGE